MSWIAWMAFFCVERTDFSHNPDHRGDPSSRGDWRVVVGRETLHMPVLLERGLAGARDGSEHCSCFMLA
jgi:hypothetical protein